MNPIRSSLPSSSWLVATVVPWLTAVIASPCRPIRSRTLRTPVRKPSAGSAGVEGVFVVVVRPVSSSTATTSVNVPPVSIPMRTRRADAVMTETLALRYRRRKGRAVGAGGCAGRGGEGGGRAGGGGGGGGEGGPREKPPQNPPKSTPRSSAEPLPSSTRCP